MKPSITRWTTFTGAALLALPLTCFAQAQPPDTPPAAAQTTPSAQPAAPPASEDAAKAHLTAARNILPECASAHLFRPDVSVPPTQTAYGSTRALCSGVCPLFWHGSPCMPPLKCGGCCAAHTRSGPAPAAREQVAPVRSCRPLEQSASPRNKPGIPGTNPARPGTVPDNPEKSLACPRPGSPSHAESLACGVPCLRTADRGPRTCPAPPCAVSCLVGRPLGEAGPSRRGPPPLARAPARPT
jgi:hypothetical protein